MELYKYCRHEHLDGLRTSGSIRIGTLHDFRNQEQHGEQVGDAMDGVLTAKSITGHTYQGSVTLQQMGIHVGEGAHIGTLHIESENLYIFSASQSYGAESHRAWFKDEKARYDACYKIHSARLFFKAITVALSERAEYLGFAPVHYYDTEKGADLSAPMVLNPAQLKGGQNYEHQLEVRAFWRPRQGSAIEPFVINVPGLWRYCADHANIERSEAPDVGYR